ncbi:MAG: phage major capsid protein [Bosea sp.]|uniref:phage major capsid protein n=1 Tax=Bosea sp. (in: a-proteobacteria) TaxID=1871050 RepID=UPI001ACE22E2|nr:phage major capsid protein [Bosea sp. (in: a-proteobacteria)]MBN9471887.1 phage major capsid protein [Bosea sp. (in: a-proteobacteria)]
MQHVSARALTMGAIEVKGDDDDPIAAAIQKLDTLSTTVDNRLKAIEGKSADQDKIGTRLDALEAKANRPAGGETKEEAAEVERKALAIYARSGSDVEMKAAASDNDPSGGYLVLPQVDTSIRALMTDLSPLRGLAEVVTISSSSYERFYSMGRRGAQWVAERDARPQDTARPELIKHSYTVSELYAAPAATRHVLDDASVDIASWLINNATHDFAETEGEAFLEGAGLDGTPKGLLAYPTANTKDFTRPWGTFQYVPAGHASAPTDDNLAKALVALMMTLRAPYRGNARWLMNRTTAIRVRQLQDTAKRFLWAPTGNLVEGEQGTLLGFPVAYDDNLPDIGADATPIAFGDFRQGYVIVDRQGIRIHRDEISVKGRVIFDVYKRVGGGAGDFNALKFLKIAAA